MPVNLNANVFDRYMSLPQGNAVLAEYIWIGGSGSDLRCKTRTLDFKPTDLSQLPYWNFDGSSTGQAPGNDSEVILKPVAIYPDPFRRGDNILVLCECLLPNGEPHPTNTRYKCSEIMELAKNERPWFGLEQEYAFFDIDGITPLGWPKDGYPAPQGPYYCAIGPENSYGRYIVEAHYRCCLYSGIKIAGINAEVMPSQWEFQIGPCEGIEGGDQLWVARYLLIRVCEDFGVRVTFDPKPKSGNWNGTGCHTNFSTEKMRNDGGLKEILKSVQKLGKYHLQHMQVYGEGNERRMTGTHETSSYNSFSYGIAHRGASIRIPRVTETEGKGYFEDRRPAGNMDPYKVTGRLVETICLIKDEENVVN